MNVYLSSFKVRFGVETLGTLPPLGFDWPFGFKNPKGEHF
jgi:hypothetical protein